MVINETHKTMFCDKCGGKIEHNLYHTIQWVDIYHQEKTEQSKECDICNKCYNIAFHAFLQCGETRKGADVNLQ